jgi:hypothetical protein
MRLRPAAFREFVVFPEVDEFFGCHVFVPSSFVSTSYNDFSIAAMKFDSQNNYPGKDARF